jgi:hypothetical protein
MNEMLPPMGGESRPSTNLSIRSDPVRSEPLSQRETVGMAVTGRLNGYPTLCDSDGNCVVSLRESLDNEVPDSKDVMCDG